MNLSEAVKTFVNGLNGVELSLIERAMYNNMENWIELTPRDEDSGFYPMWGYLWTTDFESLIRKNIDEVRDCGFRVFEDYETGTLYLGIDGAGYDFYEAHWTPLYKALGLEWHNKKTKGRL